MGRLRGLKVLRSLPFDCRCPSSLSLSGRGECALASGRGGFNDLSAYFYFMEERGKLRNTARVSLYIDSRVGRSKRFQPPLSVSIIASKAVKMSSSTSAMIWSFVSGAFTGQAARDVIDWCSVITLTAIRVGSAKIRLTASRILGSLLLSWITMSWASSNSVAVSVRLNQFWNSDV